MRGAAFWFLLCLLGGNLQLKAQQELLLTQQLISEALGEERTYQVQLPSSYYSDVYYHKKHYPLLIVLDGERLLPLVAQIVHSGSQGSVEQIPEMIVVGVSNTNRNRDFQPAYGQTTDTLSGTERFRMFLHNELLPQLAEDYRTADCAYLLGHSFAGLFAADAWISDAGFCAYLAIDPTFGWADSGIVDKVKDQLNGPSLPAGSLYIAQASNPFNPGIATNPNGIGMQAVKSILETRNDIRFKHDFFPEENHFSIPLIATYEGLRYIFKDYLIPLGQLLDISLENLEDHYHEFASFHGNQLPPAKVLHQVALFLFHQEGEPLRAYHLLNWLTGIYPDANPLLLSLANFEEALINQGLLDD